MIATIQTVEKQWFIVRGWLDNSEWGSEPPDPDDVWTVGDRVRLKNSTTLGTVQHQGQLPFLGGYLPYILVLWDDKDLAIPIEPDHLVRITRYIPPELIWKAPESFSDFDSFEFEVDDRATITEERSYPKPTSLASYKTQQVEQPTSPNCIGKQLPSLEDTKQECNPPSCEVLRDEKLYSLENSYKTRKVEQPTTFSSSASYFYDNKQLPSLEDATDDVLPMERHANGGLPGQAPSDRQRNLHYPEVLRDEKSYSLEKVGEFPASYIHVTSNASGSLYRYLKNIRLKSGDIASYPRVEGERNPDNPNHWYWGYNYKIQENALWKSRSLSVPKEKIRIMQCMIERDAPVDQIKAFIKVPRDESPDFLEKEDRVTASPNSEKVLRDEQTFSLERPQASGSLCRYLKNKKLKSGAIASYPRVEGDRNPDNTDHWYWSYCYEVMVDGEWKGRSLSVPKGKVITVRAMVETSKPVSAIKAFLDKEKTRRTNTKD